MRIFRLALALLAVPALAGVSALPAEASTTASYTVWATNVNIRTNHLNPALCDGYPSTTNCPNVIDHANPGFIIDPICQKQGQTVGPNPYWVYFLDREQVAWIASYYIDYPANQLPGVPIC